MMMKYLDNTRFDPDWLLDTFDELPLWSAPFGLKLLDNIDKVNLIEEVAEKIPLADNSVDLFTEIMQECGFTIRSIEHDQFNYEFVDETAMLNHYFIRLAFMGSWIALLPQDRECSE